MEVDDREYLRATLLSTGIGSVTPTDNQIDPYRIQEI